ncbi:ferredoxin [Nocardiopsis lambiniae]|uniref:NADH-ubiquinone oxidoreductase-F iron-sulfur binding region domain-containing protein n=1 Tax=Nocardiopsis lambiniae TaxID=3075539 RepID=A0ABU2M8I4_9ACTN|nr:ferredoxin [Nocardiopsis sp. DSM 44743]MDT0328980.1 NADH-ubiquinone oxidoreductase-F iron-sulfur binding region domain-containing protein [Nocardiopsis sp. DSM 44743]
MAHGTHVDLHGPLPDLAVDELITLAGLGGLRGRGGAGFPFARKLRAVQTAVARRRCGPRVVVNAAEGEPGSAKDRMLLTRVPHLVLDGAELAARALGSPQVVIGIADRGTRRSEVDPVGESLREAVAERRSATAFRVVRMPHRFVSGQAGALVEGINGRTPLPPGSPRRTSESGVGGLPTLLSNAETYAQLALLAAGGADAYAAVGTPDQPGTVLLTVGGDTVVEAPAGTPLVHVLGVCGSPPAQAVLVGGYHGAWLAPPAVARARLSRAGLAEVGGTLGAGIVLPLAENVCPLGETARTLRYLARESAGQCGPCVRGLPALADAFLALIGGEGDPGAVEAASGVGEGKGACAHPDGAAVFARSALRAFASDVSAHAWGGGCGRPVRGALPLPDGPADRYARLSVDWSRCDGHGLCAELLPELVRLDANGFPEDPDLPVPASWEADADRAVRMCPALALRMSVPEA